MALNKEPQTLAQNSQDSLQMLTGLSGDTQCTLMTEKYYIDQCCLAVSTGLKHSFREGAVSLKAPETQ